jgi:hypothetical protein
MKWPSQQTTPRQDYEISGERPSGSQNDKDQVGFIRVHILPPHPVGPQLRWEHHTGPRKTLFIGGANGAYKGGVHGTGVLHITQGTMSNPKVD